MWAFIASAIVGCLSETVEESAADENHYYQFTEICGQPGLHLKSQTVTLSEECVSEIGRIFGVEWDTFGEVPHQISSIETAGELLTMGLYYTIGTGNDVVSNFLGAECPDALEQVLEKYVSESEIELDAMGGEVWFYYLSTVVKSVRRKTDDSKPGLMWYENGNIDVGDITSQKDDNPLTNGIGVPGVASAFIHEGAHGNTLESHVQCTNRDSPYCDEEQNGAFGAQSWWLYNWINNNSLYVEWEVCYEAEEYLQEICTWMNNTEGYSPCETKERCKI